MKMMNPPNDANHLSDELLSERLDATLDRATTQRIDAHLATCAACSARYAGLKTVRVALQGLRHVEAVPDFRLSARGQPRRGPARRAIPAARPMAAWAGRLVSAAVLLCGIVLIAIALQSGGGIHGAPTAQSAQSGSYLNCPSAHCSSSMGGTAPVTLPGTTRATPTLQPSMPTRSSTPGNTSVNNPFPWPQVLLALGSILAVGGFVALVVPRRR